jgi:hypothetical protein
LPLIERAAVKLSASIALSQTFVLTVYRHSLRAPERVLTSRLCDCGLTAMAKRWYIIHAYSNFENKVADSIRAHVKLFEEIMQR